MVTKQGGEAAVAQGLPGRVPIRVSSRPRLTDDIDPAELARWANRARALPPVRRELVNRVRAEIAAGTYETPHKLYVALSAMLEDLEEGTA